MLVYSTKMQSALCSSLVLVGMYGCSGSSSATGSASGGGSSGGSPSGGAVSNTGGVGPAGGATSVTSAATGGASTTGGSVSTGGTTTASGGSQAVGGTKSSGGASAIGGKSATSATGGAGPQGGNGPTGGTKAAAGASSTGGKVATGGSASTGGDASTGGNASAGGTEASGGASNAGGNGTSAGGNTSTAPGCGSANTTSPCSKSGTTCSLNVNNTARTYYVQLPSGYSSSKPYPVVFQFHWMGGTAEQALTMYNLNSGLPAIYVTPQGLTENGNTGWANTNGQDIAFTKAMLADVQSKYCVDNARIFSTGFSYGGMMSFAVGCEMSDVFRAIAPMSGALYSDFNCKGTGPHIAMWGSHGLSDTVVPIADGRSARDKILQQDHCGTQTTPIDPSPCVSYQGCDAGYPVTWCEFDGTHQMPSFASSAIVAFFKQF